MLALNIMDNETSTKSHKVEIEISKQPTSLIYFNDWIDLELNIKSNELKEDEVSYRMVTELCFYNEDKMLKTVETDSLETVFVDPVPSNKFTLGPVPRKIKMRCKVSPGLDTSFSYFIQTYVTSSQELEYERNIAQSKTKPFRLITSKLKVEPIDWEEIWYKDEGGRDKCMQVEVGLYNSSSELVLNRRIQLKLTLMYDSTEDGTQHSKVIKQDILNVFGSPRHFIDPETGKTTVRFRIEDVSKNHQGQNFVLHIAADTSRGRDDDVASVYSPSVSVRSKRNKRQRTAAKENSYGYENGLPPPSPAHAVGYMNHMPSTIVPPAQGAIPATPINANPNRLQLGSGSSRDSPNMFDGTEDISSLREAMRGVIRWTEEVINGLYPLQWQVIGYAQYPDGTLDYNRPYHSMPNPNARISKILSMYSDATREQLRVLLGAVENTQMNRNTTNPDPKRITESSEYPNVIPDARQQPHHYIPTATPLARQEENKRSSQMGMDHMDVQNEIEYVLAVHYKSNLTGNVFGFPAYNERNELLGFYQESRANVGVGRFIPVSSYTNKDLSPIEVSQATALLLDAMKNNSQAVHALKDWGSISNLLDRVMVYDWSSKGRVGSGWWRREQEQI